MELHVCLTGFRGACCAASPGVEGAQSLVEAEQQLQPAQDAQEPPGKQLSVANLTSSQLAKNQELIERLRGKLILAPITR